ncbi:hypothetical protein ACFE04_001032 [Oxalis oulophora]
MILTIFILAGEVVNKGDINAASAYRADEREARNGNQPETDRWGSKPEDPRSRPRRNDRSSFGGGGSSSSLQVVMSCVDVQGEKMYYLTERGIPKIVPSYSAATSQHPTVDKRLMIADDGN